MITRASILCTCLLATVAFVYGPSSAQSPSAAPALKSHHLFNLPDGVTEAELSEAFAAINSAISDSGHPNAGYRLWKVTGEQSGEYGYLWEGVWPNQAAYDEIHNSESWKTAVEQNLTIMYEQIAKKQVYNHFIEIPTNGPRN